MHLDRNMLKNGEKHLYFPLEHICVAKDVTFKEVAMNIPLLNFVCMDGSPYGDVAREIDKTYPYHIEELKKRISENWTVVEPPCLLLTKGQSQRKIVHMVIDIEEKEEDDYSTLERDFIEGFKLLVDWTKVIGEYVFFVHKLDVDWWYAAMEEVNDYIHSYCMENDMDIIIVVTE